MDPSKNAVYGIPGCGACGGSNGWTGFCGGGGYVISRLNLLRMASATAAPVSQAAGNSFIEHYMRQPNSEWADVRFGCVAQEQGLQVIPVRGLYGWGAEHEKASESDIVELKQGDAPLIIHYVKSAEHMRNISLEAKLTQKNVTYHRGGVWQWVKSFMEML